MLNLHVKVIENLSLLHEIFLKELACLAQSVPVNRLVVGSIPTRGDEIFIYIYIFISSPWYRGETAALNSATQHAMPPEIGGKWGTEGLNTRFPLPTLLCAGYSVKLKINQYIFWCGANMCK